MPNSTRFTVACHILTVLAVNRDKPITSQTLANSVRTNSAVIRRLLIDLAKSGITTSHLGKGGGACLAKSPKKVSLLDIYYAVEEPGLIANPRSLPNIDCKVGRNIGHTLKPVIASAENAFYHSLENVTLKDIAKTVKQSEAA